MAAVPKVILRNPPAEQVIAALFTEIAAVHKNEARRALSTHQPELKKPETFAWKGNARARKYPSIEAIPVNAIVKPPSTIAFIDGGKGTILAEVAVAAVSRFARLAPVVTGLYSGSLEITLNGRSVTLSTLVKYATSNPFSENEEVWIYPVAFYASPLEAVYYKRDGQGIIYRIVRELINSFGSKASIQFAYVQGQAQYALPAIRIGGPGQFPSGNKGSLPGRNARRRARKKRV